MTPTEILEKRIAKLEKFVESLDFTDKYIFQKDIQILDGRNIQVGRTNGTIIGTGSDQKLSFYGETPIVQASAISAPTGGVTQDTEARTAINSIRTALSNIGIIA